LLRAAAMLSDPPPARRVLEGLRSGATAVPSLVGGPPFSVNSVKGVDLG
jgi:hypothetical protein